jgi:SAM-dependent methyltransferase
LIVTHDHDRYFEYLKGRSRVAAAYRRWFLYPRLCRHLPGDALDIGCGVGDMLAFRPRTVGADVNPRTVEYCRRRGFQVVLMPYDRLPFRSHSFDSAILDNVLEHIADPCELLDETRRVLKSRGVALVGVPGERGYAWDADHKVYYDESRLVATMRDHGFRHQTTFHIPWRSTALSARVRQYCLYASFQTA